MEKQTLITGEGITDIDYTVYISVTSVFRPADVTDTLDHMREPKSKWNKCFTNRIKKDQILKLDYEKEKACIFFSVLSEHVKCSCLVFIFKYF